MVTYTCSNCEKKFNDKFNYTTHLKRKFPCKKKTNIKSNVEPNIIKIEPEIIQNKFENNKINKFNKKKEHNCYYCNKIFSTNSHMHRHIKDNCKIKKQQDDEKETTHKKLLEELEFVKKQNEEYEKLKEQINKQNDEMNELKNKLDENDKLKNHNNELQVIINNALLNDNKLIYSTKKVNPKKPRLVCSKETTFGLY